MCSTDGSSSFESGKPECIVSGVEGRTQSWIVGVELKNSIHCRLQYGLRHNRRSQIEDETMARYVHKYSHTPARLMGCSRAPQEASRCQIVTSTCPYST